MGMCSLCAAKLDGALALMLHMPLHASLRH